MTRRTEVQNMKRKTEMERMSRKTEVQKMKRRTDAKAPRPAEPATPDFIKKQKFGHDGPRQQLFSAPPGSELVNKSRRIQP